MTSHPNRGRSDSQVTLIRHRSGFANVADRFRVSDATDEIDEFSEAVETYWLPTGYEVARAAGGTLEIYDAKGEHCEIISHSCGRPQIVGLGPNMPVLKRA